MKIKKKFAIGLTIVACTLTGCTSNASRLYKEGLSLYEDGKYEEASRSLQEAITANPDKADYYITYGLVLVELGDYEEAIIQLNKVVKDKDNQVVNENNKKAYRAIGIAYYRELEYKKAITQFEQALDINEMGSLNSDISLYLADCYEKIGEYEKSVKIYSEAIQSDVSNSDLYVKRANVYANLGDYEKASSDFDQAIEYNSNNYDIYIAKYGMLMSQGKEEEAKEVLKNALSIQASTEEDNFNVAKIHYYQSDYKSALSELQAVKEQFVDAYYLIGEIYYNQGDYSKAMTNYETYVKGVSVVSSTCYNQLALTSMKLSDYETALAYIEKGLIANDISTYQALLSNQVACYEQLADYNNAYQLAKAYMEEYPDDKDMERELQFIETRIDQ